MKKLIAIIMVCVLCMCTAIPAFAAEEHETANDELVVIDQSSESSDPGIMPMAYYDWEYFSYTNRHTGATRWYDGGHMALEVTARSNTPGLTMQVTIHIIGDRAITHDVPVDGYVYKWDWISLGSSSGRNVYIEYSCDQNPNAVVEVQAKTYSW